MTAEEFEQEAADLRTPLTAVALHYLHSQEDAEDTVQDVLARLWRMVDELHRPMTPIAKVLTRNLSIDRIRRQSKTPIVEIDSEGRGKAIGENIPAAPPPDGETAQRLQQAIEQLTPKQQLVVRLRHTEGMSTADMAELTGDSEAAIRQTLCRARQAMKKWYLQHIGE